jgi:hypothetical protein
MSKMCPECFDPAENSLSVPDLLVRDEPDEDEEDDEDDDGEEEDDENEDEEEDDGYSE